MVDVEACAKIDSMTVYLFFGVIRNFSQLKEVLGVKKRKRIINIESFTGCDLLFYLLQITIHESYSRTLMAPILRNVELEDEV